MVIDMLNVKGATITADAMGCQKEIAKKIIESGNDYSLQIKSNQKNLLDEIKAYHHILLRTNFENINYSEFETIDKGQSYGQIWCMTEIPRQRPRQFFQPLSHHL